MVFYGVEFDSVGMITDHGSCVSERLFYIEPFGKVVLMYQRQDAHHVEPF